MRSRSATVRTASKPVFGPVAPKKGGKHRKVRKQKTYQIRETVLHTRVLSHSHILTFHREIDAGCFAFFVYDLCPGDLHSVIGKLTLFREDELVRRVFIQIVDAVEHCHSRGVYHRDMKPENILVSSKTGEFDTSSQTFAFGRRAR